MIGPWPIVFDLRSKKEEISSVINTT